MLHEQFQRPSEVEMEIPTAMEAAFQFIEEVGWDWWAKSPIMEPERKLKILQRMESYFCQIEEYERCEQILKGQRLLLKVINNSPF